MEKNNQANLTDKNLDRLSELLNRELIQPTLASQIPDGAHIFHGSYDDMALTQKNLQLVGKILLGMTLGYIEDAPLVMILEYKPGGQAVVDLSDNVQKDKARTFVQEFGEQSRLEMFAKINNLMAA